MGPMTTDFDPYSILQVDPAAEPGVIRASYETLRSLYANDTDGRLREIETAYRILNDPEQRRAYDARRAAAAATPPELPSLADLDSAPWVAAAPVPDELPPQGRAPWRIGEMLKAIGVAIAAVVIIGTPITLWADQVAGDRAIDDDPAAWTIALLTTVVLHLSIIFAAYRFSVAKYKLPIAALGLRQPKRGGVLLGIGVSISAMAIVVVYGVILTALDLEPDTELPDAAFDSVLAFAVTLAIVSLLAPVAEETFFRGFVFGGLRGRFGFWPAALASGLLFAAAHIGNPGYLIVLPAIAAIGVLFAWSYDYSGSIRIPIFGHFLYNTVQILISLAASQA